MSIRSPLAIALFCSASALAAGPVACADGAGGTKQIGVTDDDGGLGSPIPGGRRDANPASADAAGGGGAGAGGESLGGSGGNGGAPVGGNGGSPVGGNGGAPVGGNGGSGGAPVGGNGGAPVGGNGGNGGAPVGGTPGGNGGAGGHADLDATVPPPVPDADVSPPESDAAPPEPDAAPPVPDAAPPVPDAAPLDPDAAPPPVGITAVPCLNGPGSTLFRMHWFGGSHSADIDVWEAACDYSIAPNSACSALPICRGAIGCEVGVTDGGDALELDGNNQYLQVRFDVTGLFFQQVTVYLEARGLAGNTDIEAWSPLYGGLILGPIQGGFDYQAGSFDWTGFLNPGDDPGLTALRITPVNGSLGLHSVELCLE